MYFKMKKKMEPWDSCVLDSVSFSYFEKKQPSTATKKELNMESHVPLYDFFLTK